MAAGRQIRLPSGVRINNGAYQVRYIGPDGKRHSKTFTHLEDAKFWHAVERRLIDQGEWTPPAARERKQSAAALTLSEWAEQRIRTWRRVHGPPSSAAPSRTTSEPSDSGSNTSSATSR